MSLFDSLNKNSGQPAGINPMKKLRELKKNPISALSEAGYNIPAGMNDPMQIAQYLVTSGQVSQKRYSQVMQMIGRK